VVHKADLYFESWVDVRDFLYIFLDI